MKADDVRPLLPALVHLARFPTCNLRVICERWGVDAARVMQAVAEAEGGAGDAGGFDEEMLQRAAKRWKLSLPAWQAVPPTINKAALAAAARKPDKRPRVGVRVAVPERSPVTDQERGRPRRKDDLYLAVCNELLVGGGRLSEGEACARHGLHGSTWIYFKKQRLGLGALDPNKLHAVACELAKKLDVRVAVPELPSTWAVAPHPVARANYAKNAGETAPFGAKSAVLAEIAGKERRHLVATLAMGIMIAHEGRCLGKTALETGFDLYDKLVELDRVREGGAA